MKSKTSNYMTARAHELNFNENVKYDKDLNAYQVKSISQKNTVHFVSYDQAIKTLSCDCLGFYNRQKCSHVVAVRVFQRSQSK